MEDKQRTPPPSVVVGSFAPAKSILPTGPVKVPISNAGQWFVPAQQLQPTLTWKQWCEQLTHTTNGRFKLLLVGAIFAMLILGPILEEMSYDYEFHEEYLDNVQIQFVENSTVNGLQLENSNLATFEADISEHFRNSDFVYIEIYYAEDGYTKRCSYDMRGITEGWESFDCSDQDDWNNWGTTSDEKIVYFMTDFENSEVLVASQHYNVERVWIEFETDDDNEGLEMVAEFLPCLGCMLIPIAVIGIFATRKNESVGEFKFIH